MIEIERKFLVTNVLFDQVKEQAKLVGTRITQNYLMTNQLFVVRIRLTERKAILCIKVNTGENMLTRREYEWNVPFRLGKFLTRFGPRVVKDRYELLFGHEKWEVDVFHEHNEGLIIAEMEIPFPEYTIKTEPLWVGEEVSHKTKYYNANLARK